MLFQLVPVKDDKFLRSIITEHNLCEQSAQKKGFDLWKKGFTY